MIKKPKFLSAVSDLILSTDDILSGPTPLDYFVGRLYVSIWKGCVLVKARLNVIHIYFIRESTCLISLTQPYLELGVQMQQPLDGYGIILFYQSTPSRCSYFVR